MGRKTRTEIKFKQMEKRRKKRKKLAKRGKNPDEYYHDGIYVGKQPK